MVSDVTVCLVAVQLEGQRQLSGLNVFFNLTREKRGWSSQREPGGCEIAARKLKHIFPLEKKRGRKKWRSAADIVDLFHIEVRFL